MGLAALWMGHLGYFGEVSSENPTARDGQDFDLLEQREGEEAVKFGAFLPADQLSGFYWG